jgi:hypothetical protein
VMEMREDQYLIAAVVILVGGFLAAVILGLV